ncbi:hypothetical protein [Alicyclobacillus acidiphilus]|uniref:hypothetical protein n=1 Tax=Alicyclobacillus acidiphilus TaxID=182455 RepID=UPI000AEA34EC|nr:hypothetical protein [Alicyclobacillus acidiphilus]
MENKLSWFGFDNRNRDRRISTREDVDPRFRIEDLSFGLSKDEAVFLMTVDNQAQVPFIGFTSVADSWVKQKRGFLASPSDNRRLSTVHSGVHWIRRMDETVPAHVVKDKPEAEMASSTSSYQLQSSDDVAVLKATFVKPTANSNEVISVQTLVLTNPNQSVKEVISPQRKSVVAKTELVESTDEPASAQHPSDEIGQDQATPSVQRFDLRRRSIPDMPIESRQGKQCPGCQASYLELTADERKWRCPKCGFDRKNRA